MDADGETHFEDLDIAFEEADLKIMRARHCVATPRPHVRRPLLVPPAPPVLMSPAWAATTYSLEQVHPGWHGDWHPVPQRVLAVYLSGSGEMTASDGEIRDLLPGTVLLEEDTTGRGHVSRVTGSDVVHVMILTLPN